MSNDLKLWIVRFVLAIFVIADLFLIGKIFSVASSPNHEHLWLIVGLLAFSLILSLPASVYYNFAKGKRWDSSNKSRDQIAIETLAKLGESRRKK